MESPQLAQERASDYVSQKSLRSLLKNNNLQHVPKVQNDINAYLYVEKFNNNLQKMHEDNYKPQNNKLFTWRQERSSPSKLKLPPSLEKKISQATVGLKDSLDVIEEGRVTPKTTTNAGQKTNSRTDDLLLENNTQKKLLQKKRREIHSTSGYETLKHKEGRQSVDTGAVSSIVKRVQKPEIRVQSSLDFMSSRNSPINFNMSPNSSLVYSSNQFDKRRLTLSKFMDQMADQDRNTDSKKTVKEATIVKMQYVLKNFKTTKNFKPSKFSTIILVKQL